MEANSTGKVFTGVREKWLPLYQEMEARARLALGPFDVYGGEAAVQWKYASTFAEISARKDCLVLGFAAAVPHEDWHADKLLQTSKHRVVHYFELQDAQRLDELLGWMAEAYALTQAGKARKAPEEKQEYATVDEYIALFPANVQAILQKVRATIRAAAPQATEKISWQMPTYHQKENLIHFAAMKNHIGIFPSAEGVAAFKDRLQGYKTTKGGIQLPLDGPIPYKLIGELTRFRLQQVTEES